MICLHKVLLTLFLHVRGIGERSKTTAACRGVHRGCKISSLTPTLILSLTSLWFSVWPVASPLHVGSYSELTKPCWFEFGNGSSSLSSCRVTSSPHSLGGGTGPRRSHLPSARKCTGLLPLLSLSKGQIAQGFLLPS